jgi:cell wall-associated NlpC family hydrolase
MMIMPIPTNAKPGDFLLVSFDGKNPDYSDVNHWLMNGGFIRLGQLLNGDGFSEFEHAAIYVGDKTPDGLVYQSPVIIEAQNTGTAVADAHRYDNLETRWSSRIINLTDAQRDAIVRAAFGYVGTPYSWPDYAALAAKRLHISPLDKALEGYVKSTKHMICSQVVARCYLDGGAPLYDYWSGYVTPGDLNNLLDEKSK